MALLRLALAAALVLAAGAARAAGPSPFGVWFTQDRDGAFEIYPCGEGQLCGRLVWMADESPRPGTEGPQRDIHNPDPARRARTLCGLEMMTGFRADGDGAWSGGTIYNPNDGEDYHAVVTVRGPYTLGLRGYVLVPLLGQTQLWTRVPPGFAERCGKK